MANENLKPMTWDELRRMQGYARVEYIEALRREFGCGVGQMAEMLGLKKKDFIRETELLGMDLHGARPPKDPEKIAAWEKFCGIEHGIVHELTPAPEPEPAPNAEVRIIALELEVKGTIFEIIDALEPYAETIKSKVVARIMVGGGAGE